MCPNGLVARYSDLANDTIGIITCGIEYNGQMTKEEQEPTYVKECIQSGAFLNVKIAHRLGGMDSKMFIDQVDFEYCYRLRKVGYSILQIGGLTLSHNLGDLKLKKIGPITLYIGNHSAFRKYYMARNAVYCHLIHPEWRTKGYCFKKITGLLLKSILFEDDKINKVNAIVRGVRDARKLVSN